MKQDCLKGYSQDGASGRGGETFGYCRRSVSHNGSMSGGGGSGGTGGTGKVRRQLVEDAFAKVDLNGAMKNKKSTRVALPSDLVRDFLRPRFNVVVRLERLKDQVSRNRVVLANRICNIVDKTLSEIFKSDGKHNKDKNGNSPKVSLEVRVVVAVDGNPLLRSVLGRLGLGCVKIALVWVLYSNVTGSILKVGRSTLQSNSVRGSCTNRNGMELIKDMSKELTQGIAQEIRSCVLNQSGRYMKPPTYETRLIIPSHYVTNNVVY